MYIDESAADLTVTVDGEEYRTEASSDLDSDGLDDTSIVETDDGAIAFTDTDADGQADLMTQLDADGEVVGQARFDPATGEWVHVEPDRDLRLGALAPTHDTDGDGVNDTVVTTEADGDTVIYTDADEDGDADYATEITGDGHITVSERTTDGDWTVIERGHLDEHGQYQPDPVDAAAEESGWIIDSRTGNWTRG